MNGTSLVVGAVTIVILVAGSLTAHADGFSCEPTEVRELVNRIHVRCANAHTPEGHPSHQVRFIAVDKDDRDLANRFASMATAALTCGLTFRVEIPSSPDDNISGCRADDCRTPTAFGIRR